MVVYITQNSEYPVEKVIGGVEIIRGIKGEGKNHPYAVVGSYNPEEHKFVFAEGMFMSFDGEVCTRSELLEKIDKEVKVGSKMVAILFNEEMKALASSNSRNDLMITSRIRKIRE